MVDTLVVYEMFPFLIGTVRTKTKKIITITITKFPFLIGTVRTET